VGQSLSFSLRGLIQLCGITKSSSLFCLYWNSNQLILSSVVFTRHRIDAIDVSQMTKVFLVVYFQPFSSAAVA
jgi:hypothetical protein